MNSPNLKFDAEKLKVASKQVAEIRDNIKAVKGEVYERNLSFFIALAAIGDLITPECAIMGSMVMRDLGMIYIKAAAISDADQLEMTITIKNLEEIIAVAVLA